MGNTIKVAIAGVGNCSSALIQGLFYYRLRGVSPSGLTHPELGGYTLRDIVPVAAFDIDERKVGLDLSEAIFAEPNDYGKHVEVPNLNVKVEKGPVLDGNSGPLADVIRPSSQREVDVAGVLREKGAQVLLGLLPVGANEALRHYAKAAMKAGCAFINATPTPIASDLHFSEAFGKSQLPLAGDDLMSQIGGTIFHRSVMEFLADRGVQVERSYQLDVGGGVENYNTIDYERRAQKREIKTEAIKRGLLPDVDIVAGTTEWIGFMGNARTSYYWISGRAFLGEPVVVDIYLRTLDAPNSGSVLLDVIRALRIALDRGLGGPLPSVCYYGFKRPPDSPELKKLTIKEIHSRFLEFAEGR